MFGVIVGASVVMWPEFHPEIKAALRAAWSYLLGWTW